MKDVVLLTIGIAIGAVIATKTIKARAAEARLDEILREVRKNAPAV